MKNNVDSFMAAIHHSLDEFKLLGVQDATAGRKARSESACIAWATAKVTLGQDIQMAQDIGRLAFASYMDGYTFA